MKDAADRRPGAVPDDDGVIGVGWYADTDADGAPDTRLTADGADLLVLTDLDGDGLADRVLRIGPDGAVHPGLVPAVAVARPPDPADPAGPIDDDAAPLTGTAPAHGLWSTLLGRLFGPGP